MSSMIDTKQLEFRFRGQTTIRVRFRYDLSRAQIDAVKRVAGEIQPPSESSPNAQDWVNRVMDKVKTDPSWIHDGCNRFHFWEPAAQIFCK